MKYDDGFDDDFFEDLEESFNKKDRKANKKENHREKTKGANKKDAKQITDVSKEFNIDRESFSDFLHKQKKAEGRGGSDNYTYKGLQKLAEIFKKSQNK